MTTNPRSLLLAFPLLTACLDDATLETTSDEAEIINGTEISSANTGIPQIANGGSGCSSVMLDNNWVLTAAHCVDSYEDHAFETDGNTLIRFPGQQAAHANAVAVDGYGRAVLVGSVWDGGVSKLAIARVRPNGSADPYFANGSGRVVAAFGNNASLHAVAIDAQGRIVVAGWSESSSTGTGGHKLLALRYTQSGAVDASFNGGWGFAVVDVPVSTSEDVSDLVIDGAGRIVLGGTAVVSGQSQWVVARLDANGVLDKTFGGGDGITVTDFASTANEHLEGLALDTQGRVVAAGTAAGQIALARYRTDGFLDTTFEGDGKVLARYGTASTGAHDVAVDRFDRIVVAGEASSLTGMLVARFTVSGGLDGSFDGNGWTSLTPVLNFSSAIGASVAIDSRGRIVVGGYAIDGDGNDRFALGRLTSTGAQDTAFNTRGGIIGMLATDSVGTYAAYTNAIAIDASDNVYVAVETGGSLGMGIAHILGAHDAVDAWPSLRIMMGNQNVAAAKVYTQPGADAALIKLATPLAMNGSTTGYQFNGFHTAATSTLVGKTLGCYGYGYNDFDGTGFGTLRTANLAVSSATAKEITLGTNSSGQTIYRGDSGGPCFYNNGTKWVVTGVTSWGNTTMGAQLAASSFSGWVSFVRTYY